MKRLSILISGLLLLFGWLNVVQAITSVTRNFGELVSRADFVFKGVVSAKTSQWIGTGDDRHIVTYVTFQVQKTYKGIPAETQTLRFLGGTVGDDTMEAPELPQFTVGQTAILFVVNNGKQFCPLVGIAQGRFHVRKDPTTGRDRIFTNDGSPVLHTEDIGQIDEAGTPRSKSQAATDAMTAEQFESEILGRLTVAPR